MILCAGVRCEVDTSGVDYGVVVLILFGNIRPTRFKMGGLAFGVSVGNTRAWILWWVGEEMRAGVWVSY